MGGVASTIGGAVSGTLGGGLLGGGGGGVGGFVHNIVSGTQNALGLGAPDINYGVFNPSQAEQDYTKQLQNYAYGNAPSAAQIQMQQGLQQATGQAQALAASQRGISPALAARYAAMGQANMSQGVAANSAALRANEQMNYMSQLGNEYQSQRTGQMAGAQLSSQNQNAAAGRTSQLLGNLGSAAMAGGAMYKGGEVPRMAFGGQMIAPPGGMTDGMSGMDGSGPGFNWQAAGKAMGKNNGQPASDGITVNIPSAMTIRPEGPMSETGKFLTQAFACGGMAENYKGGGQVFGKAAVAGNSIKNDTVPAMLSPKEIVIPRSITMAPDAGDKAKAFVEAIKKSHERNKSKAG